MNFLHSTAIPLDFFSYPNVGNSFTEQNKDIPFFMYYNFWNLTKFILFSLVKYTIKLVPT